MSQVLEPQPMEVLAHPLPTMEVVKRDPMPMPQAPQFGEFEYRPVPLLVPIAAGFLVLSVLAFVWEILVLLPLIGLGVALMGWRKIARSNGDLSGLLAAKSIAGGLALAFVASTSLHAITYLTEVPDGYQRVNFTSDISAKGFIEKNGTKEIHPDVEKIVGKPIFLKGYMYPSKQLTGLRTFVLCKDMGQCCFGGQPKPTDMIRIELPKGNAANYFTGLVYVAGELDAEPEGIEEESLKPVYTFKAKYFGQARSSY